MDCFVLYLLYSLEILNIACHEEVHDEKIQDGSHVKRSREVIFLSMYIPLVIHF